MLNFVWGILNDLSFFITIALISFSIPGIASSVMNVILGFIYLDLLQTGLWLDGYLFET